MKTPLKLVAVGGAVLLVAGCCTFLNLHCSRVIINEYDVEIYPGTPISEGDKTKMDEITAKYNKILWRTTDIDKKQVTTKGRLADVDIEQTLFSEMTSAITHGVSQRTVQAGLTAHPNLANHTNHPNLVNHTNHPNLENHTNCPNQVIHTCHPNHTNHPNLGAGHPDYQKAKEMVNELRPILAKYSNRNN